MVWLRKFLGGFFCSLALVFAMVAASTIPSAISQIREGGLMPPHYDLSPLQLAGAVALLVLSRLILVLPGPLAILFGVAWWKVTQKKPGARGWAIAASLATLLQALPIGAAEYFFWAHGYSKSSFGILAVGGALSLVGIAGLVAFMPRDALSRPDELAAKRPRIAGDGTSGVVDIVALLIVAGGYYWVHHEWMRWGSGRQLPLVTGILFWPLLLFAVLTEVLIHECGHAFVGRALGMRLRAFIVGPFQWRVDSGRWKFRFLPGKMLSGGGATALVPTDPKQSHWDMIAMIAAGPFASLCTGMTMFAATFLVLGTRYEPCWEFFSLVSTFGFIGFVVNLIPGRPEALYSDGAQIYQIAAGGAWADYHRVVSLVSAQSVTALRPRDYDMDAIQRASKHFTEGLHGIGLRLFASDYFHDSGRIPEAFRALVDADEIYSRTNPQVSANWIKVFAFGYAFLGRDSAAARRWWERLPAAKTVELDSFYWLTKSALHWIEGSRSEAEEAWSKGYVLSEQSPRSGSSDFDRDTFLELRRAMDEPVEDDLVSTDETVLEPLVPEALPAGRL